MNAWHVGIDWMISGPHGMRAAYSSVGNVSGTAGGVATRPGALNVQAPGFAPSTGSTGAKLYQIRYVHALSKRTEFTVGYSKIDNARFAAYQLGGLGANGAGQDQSAVAVALDHRF